MNRGGYSLFTKFVENPMATIQEVLSAIAIQGKVIHARGSEHKADRPRISHRRDQTTSGEESNTERVEHRTERGEELRTARPIGTPDCPGRP